jgi:hypothetical protein
MDRRHFGFTMRLMCGPFERSWAPPKRPLFHDDSFSLFQHSFLRRGSVGLRALQLRADSVGNRNRQIRSLPKVPGAGPRASIDRRPEIVVDTLTFIDFRHVSKRRAKNRGPGGRVGRSTHTFEIRCKDSMSSLRRRPRFRISLHRLRQRFGSSRRSDADSTEGSSAGRLPTVARK